MYHLETIDDRNHWHVSDEGPWESVVEALNFAAAECGTPWIVVAPKSGAPVAYGDARGVVWSGVGYGDARRS